MHREAEFLVPGHKGWEWQTWTQTLRLDSMFLIVLSHYGSALQIS